MPTLNYARLLPSARTFGWPAAFAVTSAVVAGTGDYAPLAAGGATPGGQTAPPAPRGVGVGGGLFPLFRRAAARPSPFPDLESALIAFLRGAPTVAGPLTIGFGGGGFGVAPIGTSQVKVYGESADPEAVAPYVVLTGYTETIDGLTNEDEPYELVVAVHASGLDQAVAIATAVKNAIDVPAYNPASLGRPPLAWQGGVETTAWRNTSKPRKKPGTARGGVYPYCEQITYQFWVQPSE